MWQSLHLDGTDHPVAVLAEGPALRLRRAGIADVFAPLPRLARVTVHGTRVQWRTEALLACLEAGVPVLFLGRIGSLCGACIPVRPPAQRADLAALLEEVVAANGSLRRRLDDFCRAEERAALTAFLATAPQTLRQSEPSLREAPLRQRCVRFVGREDVAEALLTLMHGLASALVLEALARRGVGPRFLARRAGGFPLPERLGHVLTWPLWPRIWALARTAETADGVLAPSSRRLAIRAFETAGLAPRCDRLLARLAGALAEAVLELEG
jgi:hypothetical protein